MKYYAVKKGRSPGIYKTWDQCQKEVIGFKGAIFKSFKNYEEAYNFINDNKKEDIQIDKNTAIAYVDGSFNLEKRIYSCGVVFFEDDKIIKKNQSYDDKFYVHRNVAGELYGAMMAIEMAISKNKKQIIIYHDYQGIASWANNQWKTNNELTRLYKEFIDEKRKLIDIKFVKVKGHSNDKYNDLADKLAKEACGIV
ncbi:MAG: ribonuclease H family protein [Tissierellia bacterium]|nr:ribonuclease H family protein [Tissierellia bacterium]